MSMNNLLVLLIASGMAQNCLNQYGKAVDWWVILKLPKETAVLLSGMEYYYCDSSSDCKSMTHMQDYLNDYSSPLQQTIGQINFNDQSTMSVLWSDQPFEKSTVSNKAHSKGILSANLNGNAFVINHSTPNFPMLDSAYNMILQGMPSSSYTYAQHYLCMSITTNEANKLAEQYIIAQTITNKANQPTQFASLYPNIFALKDNTRSVPAMHGHTTILSRGGLVVEVISKHMDLVQDFYSTLVAPTIGTGLVIESWGNGTDKVEDPQCNEKQTTFSNLKRDHEGYQFRYTKDHSKFGLSQDKKNPYVCFADMNRQNSQFKRGGTAMCFKHTNLWNLINTSFVERQSC